MFWCRETALKQCYLGVECDTGVGSMLYKVVL